MKPLYLFLITLFLASCHVSKNSTKQMLTMNVQGNCSSCQERIVKATYDAGAISCTYNPDSDILKVYYNSKRTSPEKIADKILSTGHDVNDRRAKDSIYNELPDCCKFRDHEHED